MNEIRRPEKRRTTDDASAALARTVTDEVRDPVFPRRNSWLVSDIKGPSKQTIVRHLAERARDLARDNDGE
ncbi:hypothetical protein KM043_015819 [Ampulex compressa]|nr:hypothetical protein KM043_015819 [Ampulex compressa]